MRAIRTLAVSERTTCILVVSGLPYVLKKADLLNNHVQIKEKPESAKDSGCLKSQVIILQTAQSWANAGVCGGLCTCIVGSPYNFCVAVIQTMHLHCMLRTRRLIVCSGIPSHMSSSAWVSSCLLVGLCPLRHARL